MCKKNKIFLLSAITFIVFSLFIIVRGFIEITFIGKGYNEIIKANWEVYLPGEYEEIYEKDSGTSFTGDGERYHIFRYKNAERVNHYIGWYKGNSVVLEEEVSEVLKDLEISEAMLPDFTKEYKYYIKRDSDSSKLYIIFIEELKEVYIVENVF